MNKTRNNISNTVNNKESGPIIITLDSDTNELNLENYLIAINYSYQPRFRKSELEGFDEDLNLDSDEHYGKENAMLLHDKIVKYAINHKKGFAVNVYDTNKENSYPGVRISIKKNIYKFMSIPLTKEERDTKIKL